MPTLYKIGGFTPTDSAITHYTHKLWHRRYFLNREVPYLARSQDFERGFHFWPDPKVSSWGSGGGGRCKPPSGVRGGVPEANAFWPKNLEIGLNLLVRM